MGLPDIVIEFSKKAVTATQSGALGIVGMVSYAAASIQEKVSGYLVNSNITEEVIKVANEAGEMVEQTIKHYDFSSAAIFWIGASVISFLLPILNWGKKVKE